MIFTFLSSYWSQKCFVLVDAGGGERERGDDVHDDGRVRQRADEWRDRGRGEV